MTGMHQFRLLFGLIKYVLSSCVESISQVISPFVNHMSLQTGLLR